MDLQHRFRKFLEQVRPNSGQVTQFRRAHTHLRRLIHTDPTLRQHVVATFLQGSYRRSTAIRGVEGRGASDVDLVLVTDLDPLLYPPDRALSLLSPLLHQHYPRWRAQGRSLRVEIDGVELDLVLASAPSRVDLLQQESGAEPLDEGLQATPGELAAWQSEPLSIPDREARCWRPTHPLAQLAATRAKNAACGGHYVNVVKAIKWWHLNTPGMPEHPRGYPLERLIEACCPEDLGSVAEGVTRTLEAIAGQYADGRKPRLEGHKVEGQDVLARVPDADFAAFVGKARVAAKLARRALDTVDEEASAATWQQILGPAFPATRVPTSMPEATPSWSLQEVVNTLTQRGKILVEGFDQLARVKRTLEQAVQQLGIRVVIDPSTPAELRDQLGVPLLSALEGGLLGAGIGMMAGAALGRSKELTLLGALLGGLLGAMKGQERVKAGWRLRSGYTDTGGVFVEIKLLP